MNISASRNLLQRAWEGVVSALPLNDRGDCDMTIITDMPDAEIADWMRSITVDGLYLCAHRAPHSSVITPYLN